MHILSFAPIVGIGLMFFGGCNETVEPTTGTPFYATNPPAVEMTVENEAWEGTLHYQDFEGSPSLGDVRGTMDVEVHIYEANLGYFCGRMYRKNPTAEAYLCDLGGCAWEDKTNEITDTNGNTVIYGVISTGATANLCGWLPPEEDRGKPQDPNAWPSTTNWDCNDTVLPPDYIGYWDLGASTPSATLFQFDGRAFTPDSGPDEIDFEPSDLISRSLDITSESTQEEWCGDWIKNL